MRKIHFVYLETPIAVDDDEGELSEEDAIRQARESLTQILLSPDYDMLEWMIETEDDD